MTVCGDCYTQSALCLLLTTGLNWTGLDQTVDCDFTLDEGHKGFCRQDCVVKVVNVTVVVSRER